MFVSREFRTIFLGWCQKLFAGPCFRHLHFPSFRSKLWSCASAQFRKILVKMSRQRKELRGALGHGLFDQCVNQPLSTRPTFKVEFLLKSFITDEFQNTFRICWW